MTTFVDFCRSLGILIDSEPPAGRWLRYPTEDHPRKKNGAVKYLGDVGFAQNHATHVDVKVWKPDADAPKVDMARVHAKVREHEEAMRRGWERASWRAQELIAGCRQDEHSYLRFKGFDDERGLVTAEGDLIVPMRHWRSNAVVGAQMIRWNEDERRYDKKMLPGMRAKGAVFRLGNPRAARSWLVEGFATGLSVRAGLRSLRMPDAVVVCFSDGNLVHVAEQLGGERIVFADNDASGAGERAARRTGLRWCMSDHVGHDANDDHATLGVFRVAEKLMGAISGDQA